MPEQPSGNTEHQSPREKVEKMQAEFDGKLEQILEELEVWNFRIATAYAEDQATGDETYTQIAITAKSELDTLWSYYQDWIVVSGVWDINRPQLSDRGVINNVTESEPVFCAALSNGFELDIKEGVAPELGFSFKTGHTSLVNKYLHGNIESLAFTTQRKASFSFARKSAEFEALKEPLVDAVRIYDGLLNLYTHQPSDFYRKSPKLQQQFLNSLINDLTEIITVPPYVTLCNHAEVPYLYRRGNDVIPDGSGLSLEFIEKPDSKILLSGVVKGVTILETLYDTDLQLRDEDDLIDPNAGICFVMSPSEGSLRNDEIDERDLIVPSRLIKNLDISIR